MAAASVKFEETLDPSVLNEQPRQTSIDFFAETRDYVLCTEAKWTEAGLGACSCPDPMTAACKPPILGRTVYWDAAQDLFGLPKRIAGEPCPIHPGYQMIRNAAAAAALAHKRDAFLALLYDEMNPYFGGAGAWPGWPTVLGETVREHGNGRVQFAAVAWQELILNVPPDAAVLSWAREKHGLEPETTQ
jgi:hypothetical protein